MKVANLIIDKTKGKSPPTSSSTSTPLERNFTGTSIERTGRTTNMGANYVWASLARYDDDLVAALEDWERHTRDEHGALGVRRPGSDHPAAEREGDRLDDVFEDGRWDLHKMVRCFARLGEIGEATRTVSQGIDKVC